MIIPYGPIIPYNGSDRRKLSDKYIIPYLWLTWWREYRRLNPEERLRAPREIIPDIENAFIRAAWVHSENDQQWINCIYTIEKLLVPSVEKWVYGDEDEESEAEYSMYQPKRRIPKPEHCTHVAISLRPELQAKLDKAAQAAGVNRSEYVRRAIEAALEAQPRKVAKEKVEEAERNWWAGEKSDDGDTL